MSDTVETPKLTKDGRPNMTGKSPGSLEALERGNELMREAYEEKKRLFLQYLETLWPNIHQAAKAAGWNRSQAYTERQRDELYRQRWEEIVEAKLDTVEDRVIRFGLEDRGGVSLLFPLLKAYRRERYGDRLEHSGQIASITVVMPEGMDAPDKRA